MHQFPGHLPSAHRKTAAFSPQGQNQNAPLGDGGSSTARNIPKDHSFDSRALKPLSQALWASTVALGHSLTAYRHLSRIKSATVSPDGNLGGRGYVMKLAEMRQKLYEASEALSAISDTIYDEISAPHWKPKLAQLDESDQEDVRRFIDEAQDVMEDPEADAGEEEEKIEEGPRRSRKLPKKKADPEKEASDLPGGGDAPTETGTSLFPKQASMRPPGLSDRQWVMEFYGKRSAYPSDDDLRRQLFVKVANSSEPVGEMPGGPRVDHIGPGTGSGEYGDFNQAETLPPGDAWNADGAGISRREEGGEDYDYTSEWENDFSKAGTAGIPDASLDDTNTDAWDFGIGYGARGKGIDKAPWGPHSGLPGASAQSSGDSTSEIIEEKQTSRRAAYEALYGTGLLPGDGAGGVSRSDYFPGAKDNLVSVGTSDLPGQVPAGQTESLSLMNTAYTEEDVLTPYVRFDETTRNLRDPALATGKVK